MPQYLGIQLLPLPLSPVQIVPADIDDDLILNFNKLENLINKKTKAIIIVHFNGYFKNIDSLKNFVKKKFI